MWVFGGLAGFRKSPLDLGATFGGARAYVYTCGARRLAGRPAGHAERKSSYTHTHTRTMFKSHADTLRQIAQTASRGSSDGVSIREAQSAAEQALRAARDLRSDIARNRESLSDYLSGSVSELLGVAEKTALAMQRNSFCGASTRALSGMLSSVLESAVGCLTLAGDGQG